MSELPMTNAEQAMQTTCIEPQNFFEHAPIIEHKYYEKLSVFTPENLLREARRQKGLEIDSVPAICILDPDGDLVDHLQATNRTRHHSTWACYHTKLDTFVLGEIEYGIIGRVVGAPFAVLVAEELFASGCNLQPEIRKTIGDAWKNTYVPLYVGASWTTDAPFRETEKMIEVCRKNGILAVEMEAAALYALAEAKQCNIICFAHVTNQMGQAEGDFEKGQAQGSITALQILSQTTAAWKNSLRSQ